MSDVRLNRYQLVILALSTLPLVTVNTFIYLPGILIPVWSRSGESLAWTSALAGSTALGMTATLILWGWFTDKCGEKLSLSIGLAITAVFSLLSSFSSGIVLFIALLLGGAGAASANAASGRLIVGFFPPNMRGKAMGVRQTAQPLGVACAALLTMCTPSPQVDFIILFILCSIMGILCFTYIKDPERSEQNISLSSSQSNPYRNSLYLPRLHTSSLLLQIPQTLSWTFTIVWLEIHQHWTHQAAAMGVVVIQILGAVGRIVSGHISDVMKTRIGLIKHIALILTAIILFLALFDYMGSVWAYGAMILLGIFSVADNGLTFTAVVEKAGPRYSGRALGLQNTGQLLITFIATSVIGNALNNYQFWQIFLITAVIPFIAIFILPPNDDISSTQ